MASLCATKETLVEREARLDRGGGWRGSKVPGAPQISARVADVCRGYPKKSRAAERWSGKGIAGVYHDRNTGHVHFENATAEKEYCRREGYTRDYSADDSD